MILLIFAWFDWQVIKTDNFTIFHKPGYQWEANEFLINLEYYRNAAREMTGNDARPVYVVVEDIGSYSNGIADPFLGKMQVFTYPDNITELMSLQQSWHRAVAYHELIHILHMTRTSGLTRGLNSCFGNIFSPNMYAPMWWIEGIAVYGESQISPYEGRLNDGYYDRYVKTRAKSLPGLIEISNEPLRFPVDQSYLYGGQFTQYFIETYGQNSLNDHLRIYGHYFWAPLTVILPVFGIDMSMRKRTGKDFPTLYRYFRQAIADNISEPERQDHQITSRGWYIGSMIARGHDIYYARKSLFKAGPFDVFASHRINKYDTRNAEEQITLKTNSLVTTPLRILDNKLYYTMREIKRGAANSYIQGFGYTSRLYCFDLLTNKKEFILEHDIRAFCLQSNSRLLFACDRKHAFGSELWRGQILPEKIMETDFLIYELIANDKYLIAVAARPYENSDICLIDTVTGRIEPIMITPWNEGQLYFKNESTILYIANYRGQHDAYELNLIDQTVYRITNDFAHWPLIIDNQLYFTGLNEMGFDLYRLPYQPQPFAFHEKEIIVDRPVQTPFQTRPGNFWDFLATLQQ